MPTPPLPVETVEKVRELLSLNLRHREITEQTGASNGSISAIKFGRSPYNTATTPVTPSPQSEPTTFVDVRKILKSGSKTVLDIADAIDCSPKRAESILSEMKAKGGMIFELDGRWGMSEGIHLEPGIASIKTKPGTRRFGITSDNHLCNKHARLDVLNAAYNRFEEEGITDVLNAGNWIDGEARFNKTELIVRPGLDSQLDYMIDKWPVKKGITTKLISGSDHEGWFQEREGIEVGRYLQTRAELQGRNDLQYIGYAESDIKLECGSGEACMRVVHPGGGSAYATSYTAQKLVESYQGGEKPQILVIGHYHKAEYGYPREVHCVQAGCQTDQSLFMRKLKIQAHVGYWIISVTQDETGAITRFGQEWFPFFDRKRYEHRF